MNTEFKQVAEEIDNTERSAEQQALAEAVAPPAEASADDLTPVQTEMPFAIVEGEPYTEIPRDLYIPPDALQVFLEAFEGPLDLLLYLIRKQNLDILDIPIAEITRQYMGYIDVMQELQLELAGEYLLMAAMLAEIKSRMLLPRPKTEEGQEEEDPRAELVRRLQEYERFKKAADDLDRLKRMERDVLPAVVELTERRVVQRLPDVTLSDMLKAFRDVVKRSEHFTHHHIQREPLSQRQRMAEILAMLESTEFVEFVRLFKAEEGRMGVTVTFISILELMKEGLLDIVQAEPYAPLHVRKATRRGTAGDGVSDESVDADAANAAALAQPELPDENVIDEEPDEPLPESATEAEPTAESAGDAVAAAPEAPEAPEAVAEPEFTVAADADADASITTVAAVSTSDSELNATDVDANQPIDAKQP